MIHDDLKYWIALKSIDGIGNASFQPLLNRFGSPQSVFSAEPNELTAVGKISIKSATAICAFKDWDKILRQLDDLNKMGASIITCFDESYPHNLFNIYDRPAFLYVLGSLQNDDIPVAIVGSRNASAYGRYTTDKISRELALRGITIVSGMARGIDSCAHRGALTAKGRTIAVMGSGLDVIYPPENKKLFSSIAEQGAVVTEFPPGTQPLAHNFPARNRIISGISYGVVIVEAGEKSGSLITARLAMEQGRDVFAIPGSIDSPASRGANSLIKQGAKLTENIDDILEDILPQLESTRAKPSSCNAKPVIADTAQTNLILPTKPESIKMPLGLTAQTILNILDRGEMHADDIIDRAGLAPAEILSCLINLELHGFVMQHPGKFFSIKK